MRAFPNFQVIWRLIYYQPTRRSGTLLGHRIQMNFGGRRSSKAPLPVCPYHGCVKSVDLICAPLAVMWKKVEMGTTSQSIQGTRKLWGRVARRPLTWHCQVRFAVVADVRSRPSVSITQIGRGRFGAMSAPTSRSGRVRLCSESPLWPQLSA